MSIFRFVRWIAEGEPVQLFGDGRQQRDFTYVDNVACGTIAALKPLGFEVINLGGDQADGLGRGGRATRPGFLGKQPHFQRLAAGACQRARHVGPISAKPAAYWAGRRKIPLERRAPALRRLVPGPSRFGAVAGTRSITPNSAAMESASTSTVRQICSSVCSAVMKKRTRDLLSGTAG